jgi:hypothetical protein
MNILKILKQKAKLFFKIVGSSRRYTQIIHFYDDEPNEKNTLSYK